jgi:pimeloyl-ACP methyl ester carboxylesterase
MIIKQSHHGRAHVLFAALVAALAWQPIFADDAPPAAPDAPRIQVEHDDETLSTRVIIEAQGGEVAWADLMAGLALAKGYDAGALDDVPRHRAFDLNRRHTRLILGLMNALTETGGIEFNILRPAKTGAEPKLQVTLDRRAMLASKRRFENLLRLAAVDKLAGVKPGRDYGLAWSDDDKPVGNQEAVVVLHGLGSVPEHHASLSADLRGAGLRVGEFAYPGDEALDDSARLLARELKRFAREQPEVRLRVVTLSMGGLVARRALEDIMLDPGNVVQLVMVASPNHGSALAYCGFGLQIWQFLDDAKARSLAERFYNTVEDGLSEASDDLRPDSMFLKELNARPRNPRVRYASLLGTGAALSEHAVEELRARVTQAKQRRRFVQFLGPKIDRVLNDADELIHGKGDGVVSVKRGQLEGVDDMVTLDFDHLSIGQPPQTDGQAKLRNEIIKRLKVDL